MKTRRLSTWILSADLIWIAVALLSAEILRYGIFPFESGSIAGALLPFLITTWAVWVFLSEWMELDAVRGGWRLPAVISQVLVGVFCAMGLLLAIAYLARHYVSRLALLYFGILLLLGFTGIRCAARLLLHALRQSGDVSRIVILGTGRIVRELAIKIEHHPEMLCRVVGCIFPEKTSINDLEFISKNKANSVQLSTLEIASLLKERNIDEVIVALPEVALPEIEKLLLSCREAAIRISMVPQTYELYLSKPKLLDLDGLPLLQLSEPAPSAIFLRSKRLMDLIAGIPVTMLALVFVLPAASMLRVKKGRAFRGELRCGQFGQPFRMFRLNVDRHVPHSSWVENVLEMLSITEMPQLWNVIRGDMSLVGPRPEALARVKHYSEWQQQRLNIKPGITGLAQVHGLREQNSSEEKARFDLQYIMNPSLIWDISLLLQTMWTLGVRIFSPIKSTDSLSIEAASVQKAYIPFVEEIFSGANRTQPSAD